MKKVIVAFIAITILTVLLPSQEKIAGQLPQMPQSERLRVPEIKDNAPFSYAYMEFKGSYQQVPAKIQEFMAAFFQQKLTPVNNFFGMYFNSPSQVKEEELQWRLAFPVAADAAVAEPLQKGEFNYTKVAVYLYIGPYDKVDYAYGKIAAFCDLNGYKTVGPCIEKYLDMDPMSVKPEALRTEINVPVEKKSNE